VRSPNWPSVLRRSSRKITTARRGRSGPAAAPKIRLRDLLSGLVAASQDEATSQTTRQVSDAPIASPLRPRYGIRPRRGNLQVEPG
jgi:hypothetical protein